MVELLAAPSGAKVLISRRVLDIGNERFALGHDFGRDDGFYARLFCLYEKLYRTVQIGVGHGHSLASMGAGQFYQSFRFQK